MKLSTLLLFSVFLLSSAFAPLQESWKLKKDKDGIQVFTRKVPGWTLKEYKVKVEINSTLDKVYQTIMDISSYTQWQHNCGESRELNVDGKKMAYVMTKAPGRQSTGTWSSSFQKDPDQQQRRSSTLKQSRALNPNKKDGSG